MARKTIVVLLYVIFSLGMIRNTGHAGPNRIPLTTDEAYYKVVGVKSDDVLWIRERPDPNSKPIGSIPPNGRCIISWDETKKYKESTWIEASYSNKMGWGWVNAKYLAPDDYDYCITHHSENDKHVTK